MENKNLEKLITAENECRIKARAARNSYLAEKDPSQGTVKLKKWDELMQQCHRLSYQK